MDVAKSYFLSIFVLPSFKHLRVLKEVLIQERMIATEIYS